MQHQRINFLELNSIARADALRQMAEINNEEQLHEATTSEEFENMIADSYNPDQDFMFLQYPDDNADNITVYLKDFS